MNIRLKKMLNHLAETVDTQRQTKIEDLHRRALSWEPVERLPLVLQYPLPKEGLFQLYPHRQVFDNPEKMLYNQFVCGHKTSIVYNEQVNADLPCTTGRNSLTSL